MTSRILFALFYLVLALSTPAEGGNLWPPRNYDPGLVTEWNELLVDALPPTLGADVARLASINPERAALGVRVGREVAKRVLKTGAMADSPPA